jgi:arsenite methyltransferase
MDSTQIYQAVNDRYSAAATCIADSDYVSKVAASFGYSEQELGSIASDANLGLSCGNPHALASLKMVCVSATVVRRIPLNTRRVK